MLETLNQFYQPEPPGKKYRLNKINSSTLPITPRDLSNFGNLLFQEVQIERTNLGFPKTILWGYPVPKLRGDAGKRVAHRDLASPHRDLGVPPPSRFER